MILQRFVLPEIVAKPQPGFRGVAIVVCAVLAILVDGSATAIINTGLPYLQGFVAATPDEGSWIITAFNASYYAFILLSPWLMARVGRRPLLVAALLGFSVISLLLAVTTNYELFIALRLLQGACLGSVFVPAVIVFFTSLSARALAFAPPAFVLVSLSGATLGTVIGGYVADEYGGNMVFIPSAVATAVTALLILLAVEPGETVQRHLRFDAIGIALSLATFGSLQYLSNEGERRNWFDDAGIVTGAIVFIAAIAAFIVYELYLAEEPHVDFRMFAKYRNLLIGAIVNIAVGATGYSVTMFVGYLETAIGATPTVAGALVLVRLATYVLGVFAAFFLTRFKILNIRAVVIMAVIGSALGFAGFSRAMTTTADTQTFVGLSLIFGFFYSALSQPIGSLVVGSMPLPMLAAGVSIYKLSSPVGLMIGTGAMQTVLDHRAASVRSIIAGSINLRASSVARYVADHHGTAGLAALVATQAQTLAYGYAMFVFAIVLVPIVGIVFFIKLPKSVPAGSDVS